MSVRQRQSPGSAAPAASNGSSAGLDRIAHLSWEEWFSHASAQQRAEALGLAQEQGVVYSHQLPPVTNGVKPKSETIRDTDAFLAISKILAGKSGLLPQLTAESIEVVDGDLDELQRQIVTHALATPDLFMLQGLPGTGKSRVLAEILRQAARHGRRTLFLAAHPASLDVVLERVADRPEILPLRFLDAGEKPEQLSASVRGMTLDRQQKAFVERGVAGARGQHAQMDATCRRRRDQEPLWNELHACRQRCQSVAGELHALDATIAGLPDVVKLDAAQASRDTAFGVRTIDLRRAHDQSSQTRAASLESQQHDLARCDQEIARFANEIAGLEPGYLAKKHGRFWTLAYWTNLFNGAIVQQVEMLVEQQAQARARRQTLAGEIDMTVEEQNRLRAEFDRELTAVLHAEIETRKHALQERRQALENEERRCTEEWEVLCRKLDAEGVEKTSAGVDAARQAWAQKKMADEQRCQFAQQWVKFIEEAGADLATKLTTFANVFAGTIARWHGDAKFREAAAAPIDLVIVEDADTLTDADISKLARLGQRCILVSAALAESPAPSSWWQRLWTALGGDAGRWPCRWRREDGRLVCQMFPIATEDRLHLESERLADSPDIELRILHRPRTRPCLAQVIFPSECKFTEAFTFMVREVQEFPLEPLGATAWWNDDARRHVRHLGPNPGRVHEWLEIEPGVRLGTCGSENGEARKFASIEFDRSAGWDRAKAAAWLYRFRPVHDCERTAFLQTPYRFHAALSAVIPVVLRNDDWVYSDPCQPREGTFEFTAVPQTSRPDWPREGAGLEMDLAAAGRQTDRLPVGLRHGLPARGFVNYTEAQALIRRLETWAREHAASTTRVAVLALYAGQVELLRHLVEQSEVLRARNFSLELALPSRMHQRECDAVFLSLTRSHTHRATAFGDDGKELPLALTRPRSYLFVFGDPGALGKRASWQGPLEQLEAVTAQQEHVRISRLLAYLQKQHAKAPSGNGKE